MNKTHRKGLAGIVAVSFFITHCAMAHVTETQPSIQSVSNQNTHSSVKKTIIHIQDIHMNAEAQARIDEKMKEIIQKGEVGVVALEGAFGPIDLTKVRSFPDRRAIDITSNYLLRENRISGAVHAALVSSGKIPAFVGVDDETHYNLNIQAYRDAQPKRSGTRKRLGDLREKLIREKQAAFNPALRKFDSTVAAYRSGRFPLTKYAHTLIAFDTSASSPVTLLESLTSIESSLNIPALEKERTQLLTQLMTHMDKKESEMLLASAATVHDEETSGLPFYVTLSALAASKKIALSTYPALSTYLQYVKLSNQINSEKLLNDVSRLEEAGYASLSVNPAERALVAQSQALDLELKLLDFSLSWNEWQKYKSMPHDPQLTSLEEFYRQAEARNLSLAQNTLRAMDQTHSSVAVLVTGGFHSAGVDKLLSDAGVSIIAFVPKIKKADDDGALRLAQITREKSTLDKLFMGENIFIPQPPAQLGVAANLLLAARMHLKTGRAAVTVRRLAVSFSRHHEILSVSLPMVATVGYFANSALIFGTEGFHGILANGLFTNQIAYLLLWSAALMVCVVVALNPKSRRFGMIMMLSLLFCGAGLYIMQEVHQSQKIGPVNKALVADGLATSTSNQQPIKFTDDDPRSSPFLEKLQLVNTQTVFNIINKKTVPGTAESFHDSFALLKEARDLSMKAKALSEIGAAMALVGMKEESNTTFNTALFFIRKINDSDIRDRTLGVYVDIASNFYLEQALKGVGEIKNPEFKANTEAAARKNYEKGTYRKPQATPVPGQIQAESHRGDIDMLFQKFIFNSRTKRWILGRAKRRRLVQPESTPADDLVLDTYRLALLRDATSGKKNLVFSMPDSRDTAAFGEALGSLTKLVAEPSIEGRTIFVEVNRKDTGKLPEAGFQLLERREALPKGEKSSSNLIRRLQQMKRADVTQNSVFVLPDDADFGSILTQWSHDINIVRLSELLGGEVRSVNIGLWSAIYELTLKHA